MRRLLRRVFRLDRFRPGQQEVIERLLHGRSTLAIMPTGAGKSLCYQLPALATGRPVLVVSPLIALMKDQCDTLHDLGIAAVQLHSDLDARETEEAEAALRARTPKVVLATPERVTDPRSLPLFRALGIGLLAIDEAHCLSQWGHDFRPAYRELPGVREALGAPPVLALTATASDVVAGEIAEAFGIAADDIVHTGIYRPNLHLAVESWGDEEGRTERAHTLARTLPGSGIVYAGTVAAAVRTHDTLAAAGESVALYHGRMGAAERRRQQDDFIEGRRRVMVATCAFGMGIDKPDVRFIVHLHLPSSLDAYVQESGRAGRDGGDADCRLLYLRRDRALQGFLIAGRDIEEDELQAVLAQVAAAAPATTAQLAAALQQPPARVATLAAALVAEGLLARTTGGLVPTAEPATRQRLAAIAARAAAHRARQREGLEQIVAYAQSGECRWLALLRHFGATLAAMPCGHCDNCRRRQTLAAEAAAKPAEPADSAPAKPRFEAGMAVRVRRYGRGEVDAVAADAITVRFPDGQARCFAPDFVMPARPSRVRGGARRIVVAAAA